MPEPRKTQVCKQKNGYFHCISRNVRKAWLCGDDHATGCNYDHRRQWIVERIDLLSKNFAIDTCAYAVMSNHYHIVLHVDYERSLIWKPEEVVLRWWQIFPPKWLKENPDAENKDFHISRLAQDIEQITVWRERLADLSWFMRCLNEPIARQANKEDGCTGRFWEGRFKSQALLDNAALITCMAYVDLNPVRAKITDTLEASEYTSVAARIQDKQEVKPINTPASLVPFAHNYQECLKKRKQDSNLLCLPIKQDDYLKLVDWTGRKIKEGKRGAISTEIAPILQRLEINESEWVDGVEHYGQRFYRVVGLVRHVITERIAQGKHWFKGQRAAKLLYQ